MLKVLRWLFWLLLTMALFVGLDQLLMRVPLELPGARQAQQFYVDFRGRLVGIIAREQPAPKAPGKIDQLIEATTENPRRAAVKTQRYLYADETGALQFADSLQQVPFRYRQDAQPLAE